MLNMASPARPERKTSVGIVADGALLSAPTPAAASVERRPAQWVDPMRAVSLEFDETQESPRAATVEASTGQQQRSALAAWRAVPALVRVMFALDLLMGGLYFITRRAKDVIARPLLNFFDLNGETNLPSWYSAGQLALIGGLLVAFAATQRRRRETRAAWSLMLAGGVFLFLSLDEVSSLHENFGYWLDKLQHRRDTVFVETGFWMLFCAPLFLVAIGLLAIGARRYLWGRKSVAMKFAAGIAIFIVAAAGVEALSNFATPHGAAARGLVLLEEMGEMLGATVILWGVCELLRGHGVRLMATDADDGDSTGR